MDIFSTQKNMNFSFESKDAMLEFHLIAGCYWVAAWCARIRAIFKVRASSMASSGVE